MGLRPIPPVFRFLDCGVGTNLYQMLPQRLKLRAVVAAVLREPPTKVGAVVILADQLALIRIEALLVAGPT